MKGKYLIIAAGGSGGHVYPACSLAQEMLDRGLCVLFITDRRGVKYIRDKNYKVVVLRGRGLIFNPLLMILFGISFVLDLFYLLWLLRGQKAFAAIGFGGYITGSVIIASYFLGIPILLHEQNTVLGRVNRLGVRLAESLSLGFEEISSRRFSCPVFIVGIPLRRRIREEFSGDKNLWNRFDKGFNLLVIGGSQGASRLSDMVMQALSRLPSEYLRQLRVYHQSPLTRQQEISSFYKHLGVVSEVEPFFMDIESKLSWSHLVISRAGASSLAEISVAGRPAVLVPYSGAIYDHQLKNAEYFVNHYGGWLVKEGNEGSSSLSELLISLFKDNEVLLRVASNCRRQRYIDAHKSLADIVCEYAGSKR